MAKKTYEVKTPLQNGKDRFEAGEVIELEEKVAAQLVEAGALVEQLSADKKAAK